MIQTTTQVVVWIMFALGITSLVLIAIFAAYGTIRFFRHARQVEQWLQINKELTQTTKDKVDYVEGKVDKAIKKNTEQDERHDRDHGTSNINAPSLGWLAVVVMFGAGVNTLAIDLPETSNMPKSTAKAHKPKTEVATAPMPKVAKTNTEIVLLNLERQTETAYKAGDFDKTLKLCDEMLSTNPDHGFAYHYKALTAEKYGKQTEALSEFHVAARLGFAPSEARLQRY